MLRRIYEQSMRENKAEMEALYMKKVMQKKTVRNLNLAYFNNNFQIREYEEVQEARYQAELVAKRTQIKHLTEKNLELEKMWLETRDRINIDALELVNYRELLAPEYDRKMNMRTSAIQVNVHPEMV